MFVIIFFDKNNLVKGQNVTLINKLIEECNKINDVKAVKYFLNTKIYGQWGKSNDYYPLLKGLGLGVKKNILPQIYIK